MDEERCLSALRQGETGRVKDIEMLGSMRTRLLDMGLIEHTKVECVGHSPCGDPSAYMIRGAVIAIRAEDAKQIMIEVVKEKIPNNR